MEREGGFRGSLLLQDGISLPLIWPPCLWDQSRCTAGSRDGVSLPTIWPPLGPAKISLLNSFGVKDGSNLEQLKYPY